MCSACSRGHARSAHGVPFHLRSFRVEASAAAWSWPVGQQHGDGQQQRGTTLFGDHSAPRHVAFAAGRRPQAPSAVPRRSCGAPRGRRGGRAGVVRNRRGARRRARGGTGHRCRHLSRGRACSHRDARVATAKGNVCGRTTGPVLHAFSSLLPLAASQQLRLDLQVNFC